MTQAHRIFVSYKRHVDEDATLARLIKKRLVEQGHEAFMDVDMPVGTNWSTQIDFRIQWCDRLIVLLSSEAAASEMVQGEVRLAHGHSKKILPIRLKNSGQLGYALDSILGQINSVLWTGSADDELIIGEILRSLASVDGGLEPVIANRDASQCPPEASHRPQPKADVRRLRSSVKSPGAALGDKNAFYVRRSADDVIEEAVNGESDTLVIRGPNQTGKSSLLIRYLRCCIDAGKKVALVDLTAFGAIREATFPKFAAQFARSLVDELGIAGVKLPILRDGLALTRFVQDKIIAQIDGSIVIAIDDADRAIGSSWQDEFYSNLRSWQSSQANPSKAATWARLGLAFVISTEPKMLIESYYRSPFNVNVPIVLRPFSREALNEFNRNHDDLLDREQLDHLHRLLGGHPFLTQVAFYRLIFDDTTFALLCKDAAREYGPFGDHLRSKLDNLHRAGLVTALQGILASGKVANNDRRLVYRLEAAGLVREEEGAIVLSNLVYEQFFRTVL